MTSPADIDSLIAALHPHVAQYLSRAKHGLYPDNTLKPRRSRTLSLSLLDSLAVLIQHYPGCNAAAVTAQTHEPGRATIYICPSPSIPHGLEDSVKEWLTHFLAMRKECCTRGAPHNDSDTFSESEKRFILHIHRLCYPAMRQRAISRLSVFDGFIEDIQPGAETATWKPKEEEDRLREELADDLRRLTDLIQTWIKSISRASLGEDEDVLGFYNLCFTIRDILKGKRLEPFLGNFIYRGHIQETLKHLRLPGAVATFLTLSRSLKLFIEDQCSVVIVDPTQGSRPFRATMTETHLVERFKMAGLPWSNVVRAFDWSVRGLEGYDQGLEWDPEERMLSSPRPVIAHPEITLIQHLLENSSSEEEAKGYIACSAIPCYASVLYAGTVNEALEAGFTMRTEDPDWCRLRDAPPWVLPDSVRKEVVDMLEENLLRDLDRLVDEWCEMHGYW